MDVFLDDRLGRGQYRIPATARLALGVRGRQARWKASAGSRPRHGWLAWHVLVECAPANSLRAIAAAVEGTCKPLPRHSPP